MTINIRKNVFETNSSSSHSVTMHYPFVETEDFDTIKLDNNGNLVLNGGDFASTEIYLDNSLVKINYVAAHIMVHGDEEIKERFESVLKEQTGAKKIVYNIRFTYSDGQKANTFFSPEYSYPIDNGYYGECGYEDYESEEIEERESDPVSFEDILMDKNKLKIFLFSKEANVYSEISHG